MLASHFGQLVVNPRKALESAERQSASLLDLTFHILVLALIPTICGYIATVEIGWDLGTKTKFFVPPDRAIWIAIAAYVTFISGVFALGYAIQWVAAGSFDLKPDYLQCLKLAVLCSVPVFVTGFAALLPVMIFDFSIGLLAVAAALFLVYTGAPIFLHVPKEEGYVFATWIVAIALIMVVVVLAVSVLFFTLIG